MVADEYNAYYEKIKPLITKAQKNANSTGEPFVVAWDRGDMFLIPAYNYRADRHGCAEFIRYPKGYQYPYVVEDIFEDVDLPLW